MGTRSQDMERLQPQEVEEEVIRFLAEMAAVHGALVKVVPVEHSNEALLSRENPNSRGRLIGGMKRVYSMPDHLELTATPVRTGLQLAHLRTVNGNERNVTEISSAQGYKTDFDLDGPLYYDDATPFKHGSYVEVAPLDSNLSLGLRVLVETETKGTRSISGEQLSQKDGVIIPLSEFNSVDFSVVPRQRTD